MASVMDMHRIKHTNKIIGYSYNMNMDTNLVIRAMKNAYVNAKGLNRLNTGIARRANGINGTNQINEINGTDVTNGINGINGTDGLIFHSDLGTQYTSREFNALLKEKGIIHSYSKKGTPYDNAKIESFHSIIKKEEIYVNRYKSFKEAKIRLFEYIEHFYNRITNT